MNAPIFAPPVPVMAVGSASRGRRGRRSRAHRRRTPPSPARRETTLLPAMPGPDADRPARFLVRRLQRHPRLRRELALHVREAEDTLRWRPGATGQTPALGPETPAPAALPSRRPPWGPCAPPPAPPKGRGPPTPSLSLPKPPAQRRVDIHMVECLRRLAVHEERPRRPCRRRSTRCGNAPQAHAPRDDCEPDARYTTVLGRSTPRTRPADPRDDPSHDLPANDRPIPIIIRALEAGHSAASPRAGADSAFRTPASC